MAYTIVYDYADYPAGGTDSSLTSNGSTCRGNKVATTSSILHGTTPSRVTIPYTATGSTSSDWTLVISQGTTVEYSKSGTSTFATSGTIEIDISDNTSTMDTTWAIYLIVDSSNVSVTRTTWGTGAASYDGENTLRANYNEAGAQQGSNEPLSDIQMKIETGSADPTTSSVLLPPPVAWI